MFACGLAIVAGCTARTNIGATGTAAGDVEHLWVVVEEIWLATEADALPESDTGWTRERLSDPVLIDLANVKPGTLVPLITNLSIAAGNYRQLHLDLADSGDRLLDVAQKAGLDYNAQVDLRNSNGSQSSAALELPVPGAGLTIPVDLTFSNESGLTGVDVEELTNLAVSLDATGNVVSYEYGSGIGYLLTPEVSVLDSLVGTITGRVDTTALPSDHPPIIVSAQVRDETGSHHVVAQRVGVSDDGSFSLFPLRAAKGDGEKYDVVIACACADTVIVRDVPVIADDDSTTAASTTLQSTPILMSPATTVYANTVEQSPALPAGTRVEFFQSLPGFDDPPYLVDGASIEPLTGGLPDGAFALSSGSLVAGTFAASDAISFETYTPAQGRGSYLVGTSGLYRETTLAGETVDVDGSRREPTEVAAPFPPVVEGGVEGTLTLDLQVPFGRFDAGFVTVSAGGRLMEVVAVDALLRRGGGTFNLQGLPAGNALAPIAGVSYQVALRAWDSSNPSGTITRVAAFGSATLGDTGGDRLSLQVQ
jgi:hypothetical protein